jgi:hypothetical protein
MFPNWETLPTWESFPIGKCIPTRKLFPTEKHFPTGKYFLTGKRFPTGKYFPTGKWEPLPNKEVFVCLIQCPMDKVEFCVHFVEIRALFLGRVFTFEKDPFWKSLYVSRNIFTPGLE